MRTEQTNSPVNHTQVTKNDLSNYTAIKIYETRNKSVDLNDFDDHPLSMSITKEKETATDWQNIFSKT